MMENVFGKIMEVVSGTSHAGGGRERRSDRTRYTLTQTKLRNSEESLTCNRVELQFVLASAGYLVIQGCYT